MAAHHLSLGRVTVKQHDGALHVDVVRGVGYRAYCSCGWESPVRREWTDARTEHRFHERYPELEPAARPSPPVAA